MNECEKKHQTVTVLTKYSYFVLVVMGREMMIDSILQTKGKDTQNLGAGCPRPKVYIPATASTWMVINLLFPHVETPYGNFPTIHTPDFHKNITIICMKLNVNQKL